MPSPLGVGLGADSGFFLCHDTRAHNTMYIGIYNADINYVYDLFLPCSSYGMVWCVHCVTICEARRYKAQHDMFLLRRP